MVYLWLHDELITSLLYVWDNQTKHIWWNNYCSWDVFSEKWGTCISKFLVKASINSSFIIFKFVRAGAARGHNISIYLKIVNQKWHNFYGIIAGCHVHYVFRGGMRFRETCGGRGRCTRQPRALPEGQSIEAVSTLDKGGQLLSRTLIAVVPSKLRCLHTIHLCVLGHSPSSYNSM